MAITRATLPKMRRGFGLGGSRGAKVRLTEEDISVIINATEGSAFRLDDYKSITPALREIAEANGFKLTTRTRYDANGLEVVNANGRPVKDIYAVTGAAFVNREDEGDEDFETPDGTDFEAPEFEFDDDDDALSVTGVVAWPTYRAGDPDTHGTVKTDQEDEE